MLFQAAVLVKPGEPLVLDRIEVVNPGVGQVTVAMKASGICGTQLAEASGAKGEDKYLPHLMGHEGAGVVAVIGPGVTRFKIGDHVVCHWRKGAGIDAAPARYNSAELARVGGGPVTTFCVAAHISENRLTWIPDDVPFDVAALMGCAVTTGLGAIFHEAQVKPWHRVGVCGCGGVGLNAVQGARIAGAERIYAREADVNKLGLAFRLGATDVWGIGQRCDVIVETTGKPELIAECLDALAPGGTLVLVGVPDAEAVLALGGLHKQFMDKRIVFSLGGRTSPNEDIPRYLRLWERGLLNIDEMITHRFPLEQVNEAMDVVRAGRAGRVILEMK